MGTKTSAAMWLTGAALTALLLGTAFAEEAALMEMGRGFRDGSAFHSFPTWRGKDEGANCMVGVLPMVKMSFSSSSAMTALFNKGCANDEQCRQTNSGICNGHVPLWTGITQRGICFKTGKMTRSACVCGVFVNHVTDKKQCTPKDMPKPAWTMDAKEAYDTSFLEQEQATMETQAVAAGEAATETAMMQKKGITDWFRSTKRFPVWTDNKKNGKYCALGWLPYSKCGREGLKITTCSKDDSCKCSIGCPGPAVLHPTLRWQPMCMTRGSNKCVCALVSTDINAENECQFPWRIEENQMVFYQARDKEHKLPTWWDHVQ